MSAPISDDGNDSEHSTYAPKRFREQPRMPAAAQFYVKSAPTVPSPTDVDQDRQTRSEFAPWPERISEPSRRWGDKAMTLMGRIVVVVAFAALVALLTVFAKPLWQGAGVLLNADSQTSQAAKPSDRLTANNAPANNALVPATTIAAAPVRVAAVRSSGFCWAIFRKRAASVALTEPARTAEHRSGSNRHEIRFGISAALSGPTKELGQNMQRGIVAAFNVANANGGVHGRQLRLIAADDGYEPARAAETMKQLFEKRPSFWRSRQRGNAHGGGRSALRPSAQDAVFRGIHRRRLAQERSTRPICFQLPRQLR